MKREIRKTLTEEKRVQNKLFKLVCNLDNYENECECESGRGYDFRNIVPVEDSSILCLECGGYVPFVEDAWY